jgi:hypothetical protein
MIQQTFAQPQNEDQEEFDKAILAQTQEEFDQSTQGLIELAKEKGLMGSRDTPLDLTNLPFDPAVSAMEQPMEEEETEEDGIRAEAIRRLKVHRMFKGRQDQTKT